MMLKELINDPMFIILLILLATSILAVVSWMVTYYAYIHNVANKQYVSPKMQKKIYDEYMKKLAILEAKNM